MDNNSYSNDVSSNSELDDEYVVFIVNKCLLNIESDFITSVMLVLLLYNKQDIKNLDLPSKIILLHYIKLLMSLTGGLEIYYSNRC